MNKRGRHLQYGSSEIGMVKLEVILLFAALLASAAAAPSAGPTAPPALSPPPRTSMNVFPMPGLVQPKIVGTRRILGMFLGRTKHLDQITE